MAYDSCNELICRVFLRHYLHIIFDKDFETRPQLHLLNLITTNEVLLDINIF